MVSAFNLVSAFLQKMEIASVRTDVPLFIECSWDGVKLAFEKAPPRPSSPPQELIPLPTCVSYATHLPDVGWFIDDRSNSAREKLRSSGVEPVLYDREGSFILEDSQFELLGEEVDETGTQMQAIPTLSSAVSSMEVNVSSGTPEIGLNLKTDIGGIPATAVSTPSSTIPSKELAESSSGIWRFDCRRES